MPATPSSPIPGALAHLIHTGPLELQDHPQAAEFLVREKRAHYLFTVKANQPTLLARCQRLPWHRVPELDRTRDRGHGRVEVRTLKAVSVHHLGFPHAAQVLQVTRTTRELHDHPRRWRTVTVYAVTGLPHAQARPARPADYVRGHWGIEAPHHLRDTTIAEEGSQVRTGSGPHAMAALRNLVIGVLCRAGPVNGMRRIRPSSEAEMVALFLRTELPAARFRDALRALLERAGLPERVVTDPDLDDPAENQARWQLLTWHRDYGTRTGLFNGFPDDVCWEWMAVTPAELARVRYIDYDYWVELSGGTRLAVDAAPRIRAGVAPFGVASGWALGMAEAVADGARFPPLILGTSRPGALDWLRRATRGRPDAATPTTRWDNT